MVLRSPSRANLVFILEITFHLQFSRMSSREERNLVRKVQDEIPPRPSDRTPGLLYKLLPLLTSTIYNNDRDPPLRTFRLWLHDLEPSGGPFGSSRPFDSCVRVRFTVRL